MNRSRLIGVGRTHCAGSKAQKFTLQQFAHTSNVDKQTGQKVTRYASSRSVDQGHADIAWSIMHALIYEPINNDGRKTTVTFST